jgi:uncharacterized protein YkwD
MPRLFLATVLLVPLAAQDPPPLKLTADEQKFLDLTNAERKKANLPPLKADPLLCQVARAHAANMAKQGKMEHKLDGKTQYERIKGAGYKYSTAGENIARGDLPMEAVMKALMDSKVHRENILAEEFTEIGVGLAASEDGKTYYTQDFAAPRKAVKD